jgi:hypothetical protein
MREVYARIYAWVMRGVGMRASSAERLLALFPQRNFYFQPGVDTCCASTVDSSQWSHFLKDSINCVAGFYRERPSVGRKACDPW